MERALAEAGEAIRYLRAASAPQPTGQGAAIRINLNGLPDVTVFIQKLHIEGAALEPREIFDLIAFLDRAADAASFLNAAAERFPLLARRAQGIGDFRPLLKEVEGKIQADGTVLDSASPHLHRLRREIEKQKKGIQESLERFLRANRNEGVLQEEYITIRNERFVVPVISGQRRKLPGVIHGASSTGQTLFLEPLETIDLNNELVRLQEEESREVFRILRELTARLRVYGEPIRAAAAIMAALDLIFAKARFAIEFDCVIPDVRRPAASRKRAPSAADRRVPQEQAARGSVHADARSRMPHAADQRPEYRRQDRYAEDRRRDRADGAGRAAGAVLGGGTAGLRTGAGRYRRQPVDRAEPEHFLGACVAAARNGARRHAGFAGAAGRDRIGHRSRRGRGAGSGAGRSFPRGGRIHARIHASDGAQDLRREYEDGA